MPLQRRWAVLRKPSNRGLRTAAAGWAASEADVAVGERDCARMSLASAGHSLTTEGAYERASRGGLTVGSTKMDQAHRSKNMSYMCNM